ncbi:MAG TPA: hypothetical protein VGQ34_08490, partial [Sphingomicrobium sp.]|nr:hypothetical protein [Sphingomicrobium sp.]
RVQNPLLQLSDVIVARHELSSTRLPTARHHLARLIMEARRPTPVRSHRGIKLPAYCPGHRSTRAVFPGWLGRIARAVESIAGIKPDVPDRGAEATIADRASEEHVTTVPDQPRSPTAKGDKLIRA